MIKLLRADYDRALAADLWQRMIVSLIAALAGAGLGIAWRQVENTTRLQLRLARASQLNLHLQEMTWRRRAWPTRRATRSTSSAAWRR